jgi:putative ABC transport system permease protein
MRAVFFLALRSLWHRRFAACLTIISIALSVALFVGVGKTREVTRDAFSGAISKVDLIVGPRTGSISLLLYSVFHVGSPTHLVSMKAVTYTRSLPQVDWVVPFSLGDGYRGYAVVGTEPEFFSRYKVRNAKALVLAAGSIFSTDSDVVIGADVAQSTGLKLGDSIVLSHGHTEDGDGFERHEEHPFKVSGILAPAGAPVDKSLFVSLSGQAEIHRNLIVPNGQEKSANSHDHDVASSKEGRKHDHDHDHDHSSFEQKNGHLITVAVSGFFLGTKERSQALELQRHLNTWNGDALLAIMPGMAMAELWKNLSVFETALRLISFAVVVSGVIGLFVSLFILSGQRRREMVVLRAVGAGPASVFGLLAGEAVFLVLSGILVGWGIMYGGFLMLGPWLERRFSLALDLSGVSGDDVVFASGLLLTGCLVGVFASIATYRAAMRDGFGMRF